MVQGYRLAGSTVQLTWYDSHWAIRSQDSIVANVGWFAPDTGAASPDLPDQLQSVWIPFVATDLAPNFWIHIGITNGTGKQTTHRYSLGY